MKFDKFIHLPGWNKCKEEKCEYNDCDVQAVLFAFEMVESVNRDLSNLVNRVEEVEKKNAEGENAGSDDQGKEAV